MGQVATSEKLGTEESAEGTVKQWKIEIVFTLAVSGYTYRPLSPGFRINHSSFAIRAQLSPRFTATGCLSQKQVAGDIGVSWVEHVQITEV